MSLKGLKPLSSCKLQHKAHALMHIIVIYKSYNFRSVEYDSRRVVFMITEALED